MTKMLPRLLFESDDGRFAVDIDPALTSTLIEFCNAAGMLETGGVLVGSYTPDHHRAVVKRVLGPPADSSCTRRAFERGLSGLNAILGRLWRTHREFYLGEWHFHPGGAAAASPEDMIAMTMIARDPAYRCPEPVLLIVGGSPPSEWQAAASVFPAGRSRISLHPVTVDASREFADAQEATSSESETNDLS